MALMERRLSRLSGLRLDCHATKWFTICKTACLVAARGLRQIARTRRSRKHKPNRQLAAYCTHYYCLVITPPLGPGLEETKTGGYNLVGFGSDTIPSSLTRLVQCLLTFSTRRSFFFPALHMSIWLFALSRPDNCAACAVQATKPARTPCKWSRWA